MEKDRRLRKQDMTCKLKRQTQALNLRKFRIGNNKMRARRRFQRSMKVRRQQTRKREHQLLGQKSAKQKDQHQHQRLHHLWNQERMLQRRHRLANLRPSNPTSLDSLALPQSTDTTAVPTTGDRCSDRARHSSTSTFPAPTTHCSGMAIYEMRQAESLKAIRR